MNSSDSFLVVIKDSEVDFQNIEYLNRHVKKLLFNGCKNISFDMQNVKIIDNTFLEFLKKMKNDLNINLFNINPDIMSVLFLTRFDKFVKIYNNETDADEALKPLVKRNFSLVR